MSVVPHGESLAALRAGESSDRMIFHFIRVDDDAAGLSADTIPMGHGPIQMLVVGFDGTASAARSGLSWSA